MLHLLCCIRLYSTPCQIFCNNHLWCSALKQRQNTKPHRQEVKVIISGDGIHHTQSGLLLTKPLLWQLHIHECCPLTVAVWQSLPCWKRLVWNQIKITVEKNEGPLLQNICLEVQNHLHVCYATSGAHNELAQGMWGSGDFLGGSLQQWV